MARRRKDRDVFTTGEVAKLCSVTIRTVINWFETGRLKGYKIPGSTARRIPRESLVEFMRAHDMPLGDLEPQQRRRRVLVVDDEPAIVDLVQRFLVDLDLFDIETATNGYQAGTRTMTFRPDLLLIDYNLGDVTGVDVARTVRDEPALEGMKILCMSGFLTEETAADLIGEGIDDFIPKPLDLIELRRRILRLTGLSGPAPSGPASPGPGSTDSGPGTESS